MIYSDEKGDQLSGKRAGPDGKCCVAGVRKEKEKCQIYASERQWGLRSVQTSRGALNRGGGMQCRMKYRAANPSRGAPMGIEEGSPSG